jgi:hypothetical protein
MFMAQVAPSQPVGQAQLKASAPSVQAPSFEHGTEAHSSLSVPQVPPL